MKNYISTMHFVLLFILICFAEASGNIAHSRKIFGRLGSIANKFGVNLRRIFYNVNHRTDDELKAGIADFYDKAFIILFYYS